LKGKVAKKRSSRRTMTMGDVPPKLRWVLSAVPVRNEAFLKWEKTPEGLVTVTHAKNLGRFERWLMKKVGGSPTIKRKLDAPASDIWVLCDGKHMVAEICSILDGKYNEKIEPVLTRVVRFLEILLARNLIFLKPSKDAPDMPGTGACDEAGETRGMRKGPVIETNGTVPTGENRGMRKGPKARNREPGDRGKLKRGGTKK